MMKPSRSLKIALVILVAWNVLSALPASSQIQYAPTIMRIGKWLGEQFLGYATGKAFDKILGYDHEKQLTNIQTALEAQLRRGSNDAKKVQAMRAELDATRSQLAMLRTLMTSKPSTKEMESFRLKLASDLEKLKKVQRQHEERIEQHEARIDQHDLRLEKIERDVTEMAARLRGIEDGSDTRSHPDSFETNPSLGSEYEERPQTRSWQTPSHRRGVTLIVGITGNSNEVRVQEVDSPEDANVGSFEANGRRNQYIFYLLAGTGSVINLSGDANRIFLPSFLCGRVRVVSRGEQNRVVGCN